LNGMNNTFSRNWNSTKRSSGTLLLWFVYFLPTNCSYRNIIARSINYRDHPFYLIFIDNLLLNLVRLIFIKTIMRTLILFCILCFFNAAVYSQSESKSKAQLKNDPVFIKYNNARITFVRGVVENK